MPISAHREETASAADALLLVVSFGGGGYELLLQLNVPSMSPTFT